MYPVIDMEATGIRLRRIMEQKKITAKCIQQYLGLACVQSIYRWLNGRSMPTIDHLYALSELFRMPLDDIVVENRTYQRLDYNWSFYLRISAYCNYMKRSVL